MTPSDNLSTLDFLRAFSTVAVVAIHWMGMTGRFPSFLATLPRVVVLMFFVHTGFVLMLSLERQHAGSAERLWRHFMVRRIFRVYPLSTFVIALILLFGIPGRMIPPNFTHVDLGAGGILANFLLVMNLFQCEPVLSPMWSLPYEFQLYLLLPAVYLLSKHRSGLWLVVGLWCLSLALALLQLSVPHAGRLDILTFAPCLVAGILCYRLTLGVSPRLPFMVWPLLLPSFMASSLLWPDSQPWPSAWMACLLTALCAPFIKQTSNAAVCRLSGTVAQHSYSIYLTHYFCLWLAFRANALQAPLQWLIFSIAIVGLPALLYRYIELPMIRMGRRLSETAANVVAAHTMRVTRA